MLKKYKILIPFFLVIPSLVFAEPVETGSMHAGLKSIGSDRPADIMENPGLLSFPKTSEKNAVMLRDTVNIYLELYNPLFGDNQVSGYITNSTSLGYAHLNRKKGKVSFGIFLHNDFQNIFEDMGYFIPLQSIIPTNMSVTDQSINFAFTPLGIHSGIGASLKLSDNQSIGISVLFTYLSLDFQRKSSMQMKNSGTGLTGYSNETNQTELSRLKAGVLLGYVSHTRDGELTFTVKPFSYMESTISRKIDYLYKYNSSTVDSISNKTNYTNSYIEPIEVQAGISQKLFPFMKVFIEGSFFVPMTMEYRTDELYADTTGSNAEVIQFNVKETYDFSPTLKVGLSFFLKNDFTIHAGFSWFSGSRTLIYRNVNNISDSVSQVYTTNDHKAQLGLSKLFIHRILTYFSVSYFSGTDKIQDSKYISGSSDDNVYNSYFTRLDLNLGAEYHF